QHLRVRGTVLARHGPGLVEAPVPGAAAAAGRPLPPAVRQEILGEASRLLAARREEIRELYVAETGFTPADADTEITRAVGTIRLSAQESVRIAGEEVPGAATPGSDGRPAVPHRVAGGRAGAPPR